MRKRKGKEKGRRVNGKQKGKGRDLRLTENDTTDNRRRERQIGKRQRKK